MNQPLRASPVISILFSYHLTFLKIFLYLSTGVHGYLYTFTWCCFYIIHAENQNSSFVRSEGVKGSWIKISVGCFHSLHSLLQTVFSADNNHANSFGLLFLINRFCHWFDAKHSTELTQCHLSQKQTAKPFIHFKWLTNMVSVRRSFFLKTCQKICCCMMHTVKWGSRKNPRFFSWLATNFTHSVSWRGGQFRLPTALFRDSTFGIYLSDSPSALHFPQTAFCHPYMLVYKQDWRKFDFFLWPGSVTVKSPGPEWFWRWSYFPSDVDGSRMEVASPLTMMETHPQLQY